MAKQLSYEQIAHIAAQEGARAAQKHFETLVAKDKKERKDARLHNTKLLLKNYRMLKANAESAVYRIEDCEESAFDILALMDERAFSRAETTVESIKNSATRTAIMVEHIQTMVGAYEIFCERSGKEENMRRARILLSVYISDDGMTVDELSDVEHVDRRTIYRDLETATESLAAMIFGVDGILR